MTSIYDNITTDPPTQIDPSTIIYIKNDEIIPNFANNKIHMTYHSLIGCISKTENERDREELFTLAMTNIHSSFNPIKLYNAYQLDDDDWHDWGFNITLVLAYMFNKHDGEINITMTHNDDDVISIKKK